MPITINGTGTITGISAGGLPDNCVTVADLATTLDLSSNTVTLPSGTGGKVLQITQNTDSSQAAYSTRVTNHDIFSGTITPVSSTSDILVIVNYAMGRGNNETWYLKRGSDKIGGVGGSDSTYIKHDSFYSSDENPAQDYSLEPVTFTFFDTTRSSGTSQLTYTLGVWLMDLTNAAAYYNRSSTTNDSGKMTSTITLIEYAA